MERIQPIETVYDGYRFRSRLEARWAVFFNVMGIKYEYEPEGFEVDFGIRYLPDFAIDINWRGVHGQHYTRKPGKPVYVEIKGKDRYSDISINERVKIESFSKYYPLLILGSQPIDVNKFIEENMNAPDKLFSFFFLDGDDYPCFFSKYNGANWLAGPDHNEFDPSSVEYALAIARQARFEHGETPIYNKSFDNFESDDECPF